MVKLALRFWLIVIDGVVGEVTGIFGQKKAREMVAEEVFRFLKDIERQRKASMSASGAEKIGKQEADEDEDEAAGEKRKRRSSLLLEEKESEESEESFEAAEEGVKLPRDAEAD